MATWAQMTDSFGYTYRVNPLDDDMYCETCLLRGGERKLVYHYRDADNVFHYKCESNGDHTIRIKNHSKD